MTKYFYTHTYYNTTYTEVFKIWLRILWQFLFNSICWENIFCKPGGTRSRIFPTRCWSHPS